MLLVFLKLSKLVDYLLLKAINTSMVSSFLEHGNLWIFPGALGHQDRDPGLAFLYYCELQQQQPTNKSPIRKIIIVKPGPWSPLRESLISDKKSEISNIKSEKGSRADDIIHLHLPPQTTPLQSDQTVQVFVHSSLFRHSSLLSLFCLFKLFSSSSDQTLKTRQDKTRAKIRKNA